MKIDFEEQLRREAIEWQEERKRLSKLEWKCALNTAYAEGYAIGLEAQNKGNNLYYKGIIKRARLLGISAEDIAAILRAPVYYVEGIIVQLNLEESSNWILRYKTKIIN